MKSKLLTSYIALRTSYIVIVLCLVACSTTKYVPDGSYLLEKVKVKSDTDDVQYSQVKDFVKIHSNSKIFSVFNVPLWVYNMSGADTSKWKNRFLRGLGEEPILYDSAAVVETQDNLNQAISNMGYLHGYTEIQLKDKGKKRRVTYIMHPGEAYYVQNVRYNIKDDSIRKILEQEDPSLRLIHEGIKLNVDILDAERKRISNKLLNLGYYRFNKDFIRYYADTIANSKMVDVTLILDLYKANNRMDETKHPHYKIGKILYTKGEDDITIRQSVLEENTMLEEGKNYSDEHLKRTYNNFGRLQAIKYTNIALIEHPDTNLLDCNITTTTNKPSTISFQPEGTNTAGDLGAAGTLSYANRNIFHGSEVFNIQMRLAYEHIKNLEGYSGHHFWEHGLEASLSFPRFMFPFLSRETKRSVIASSDISVSYNRQDRPEYHRRVFSGGLKYKWSKTSSKTSYKFDLINLNFVSMPWISDTFRKTYLEDETSKNAILRYNYQDLFIMNLGFGISYNDGTNAYKINIEPAGNLLNAISSIASLEKNKDGQYKVFGIAFAQYIKGDFDFTHSISFDKRNSLVLHGGLGIAYPYGNSSILPFEKRYFSGGANSVRGWSVRSLGPGSYVGADGNINFINQTGDMRLDLNAELRTYLFWKFNGAFFIDAGNIWTLREYKDQPGGQFRFNSFLSQIAASYGLGLRLNFDYFVLRFDMAMKAINPQVESGELHYPIIHPKFSRDFTFHFAVGMPF